MMFRLFLDIRLRVGFDVARPSARLSLGRRDILEEWPAINESVCLGLANEKGIFMISVLLFVKLLDGKLLKRGGTDRRLDCCFKVFLYLYGGVCWKCMSDLDESWFSMGGDQMGGDRGHCLTVWTGSYSWSEARSGV